MLADKLLNVGGLCVVLAGMCFVNEDARQWTGRVLGGDFSAELSLITKRAFSISQGITDSLGGYASDHVMLAAFAIGAVVLVAFMLRT